MTDHGREPPGKFPCPFDKKANTPDCGNPYQHMEKNRLIEALMVCHAEIDRLRAIVDGLASWERYP